jgi:hypothetical protein
LDGHTAIQATERGRQMRAVGKLPLGAAIVAGAFAWQAPAQAVPNLQLYVEGAEYCAACPGGFTNSWAIDGDVGLRLWVIGDTSLFDVQLAVSWNAVAGNNPVFVFNGTTIGAAPATAGIITNAASAYSGINDIDAPGVVGPVVTGNPALPINGQPALYGAGREWVTVGLGDFTLNESVAFDAESDMLADGSGVVPGAVTDALAGRTLQINVYDITFGPAALAGQVVNFDVFGFGCTGNPTAQNNCTLANASHTWIAPFSHNAQWRQTDEVPEPACLALLGLRLAGIGLVRRARFRS